MTDYISFDQQVAIITGAGRGLGRAYALELARRGARVVVNDLGAAPDGSGADRSAADAVVEEIRSNGGEAVADYSSVASAEGGMALTQVALDSFGTVDIVINNAGNLRVKAFSKLSLEDIDIVLDVHLRGAFYVTQPAFGVMREKGYGRLLFTSSGAGLWGDLGVASYGAAKMGLVGLSNVLALEGAKYGITSNVIAPIAQSRLTFELLGDAADQLSPELVVPMSLYLVSPTSHITHEIFSVAGGRFAQVFVGLAPGWTAPPDHVPSLEEIREQMGRIRKQSGYIVPDRLSDEMALVLKEYP